MDECGVDGLLTRHEENIRRLAGMAARLGSPPHPAHLVCDADRRRERCRVAVWLQLWADGLSAHHAVGFDDLVLRGRVQAVRDRQRLTLARKGHGVRLAELTRRMKRAFARLGSRTLQPAAPDLPNYRKLLAGWEQAAEAAAAPLDPDREHWDQRDVRSWGRRVLGSWQSRFVEDWVQPLGHIGPEALDLTAVWEAIADPTPAAVAIRRLNEHGDARQILEAAVRGCQPPGRPDSGDRELPVPRKLITPALDAGGSKRRPPKDLEREFRLLAEFNLLTTVRGARGGVSRRLAGVARGSATAAWNRPAIVGSVSSGRMRASTSARPCLMPGSTGR